MVTFNLSLEWSVGVRHADFKIKTESRNSVVNMRERGVRERGVEDGVRDVLVSQGLWILFWVRQDTIWLFWAGEQHDLIPIQRRSLLLRNHTYSLIPTIFHWSHKLLWFSGTLLQNMNAKGQRLLGSSWRLASTWIASHSSTICWRRCFPIELHCHPCQN